MFKIFSHLGENPRKVSLEAQNENRLKKNIFFSSYAKRDEKPLIYSLKHNIYFFHSQKRLFYLLFYFLIFSSHSKLLK